MGKGPLTGKTVNGEHIVGLVGHFQAFDNIADPNTRVVDSGHHVIRNPNTIVLNFNADPVSVLGGTNLNTPSFNLGSNAVLDGILNNGLQDHARNHVPERVVVNLFFDLELVLSKADDFDIQVIVDKLELFPQRDKVFMALKQLSQDMRKLDDDGSSLGRIRANEGRNRIQGVEQKVGVNLIG